MSSSAACAAVQAVLDSVNHTSALDEDIMQYVCSIIEDPDPETSLDLLVGVLSEFAPGFAALPSEEDKAQLVLQLLDSAHETSGADVSSTAAAESSSSNSGNTNVEAMVAALRQLQCEELAVPEACADITNTARGSGASSSDTSSPEPDVGPLVELSPAGVSQQFLQHCLQQQFHNDMQATANWLLEADPRQVLQQQRAWEQEAQRLEQQRQQTELLKQKQKKLIVEKFDLRVVSDSSSSSSKPGAKRVQGPDLLPKVQHESKLRYRDGKVVSTKGERIIVEKVGEDWDGGSRGKVFTKGKRGKGFH